jgi:hypothetical protein
VQTVRDTVMNEIGHYFGFSDQRLREIEAARRGRARPPEGSPPRRRYRRVGRAFDEPADDTAPAPEEQ